MKETLLDKVINQIAYAHTLKPRTTTEHLHICQSIWPETTILIVSTAVYRLMEDGFFD